MLILSQNGQYLLPVKDVALRLKGKEIVFAFEGGFTDTFGTYETEEEAKAAFEDLIEQIDEIEGVARVK